MVPNISERMRNMNPSAIREILKALSDPTIISFAGGNPSEETFPARELGEISARLYRDRPAAFLQYGITEGYAPLRETIKERMREKYNIVRSEDEVMVITGGQQGIDLCLKALTNEGDAVIVEDPSYVGALNDFRSYRLKLIGAPSDDEGMDTDALEEILKSEPKVKLIYTIPTFQNPTGVTMSLERRKRLVKLAEKYNIIIIEDSPYFELRYSGEYVPCIKSIDTSGHVVFCGSFSKIVAPGLRVGYLIMDKSLLPKITVAKQCCDVHTALYPQMLINEYMHEYDLDEHIAHNCEIYRIRRDEMLKGLDENLDSRVSYTRPDGGLFIWCTLPQGYSGFELCKLTTDRKLACVPGSAFDPQERQDRNGVRLNFSMPTLEQIAAGTKILGDCIKDFIK